MTSNVRVLDGPADTLGAPMPSMRHHVITKPAQATQGGLRASGAHRDAGPRARYGGATQVASTTDLCISLWFQTRARRRASVGDSLGAGRDRFRYASRWRRHRDRAGYATPRHDQGRGIAIS